MTKGELRAFTLPQAIDYARRNHPRLRSQQERIRAALGNVVAANAQWRPQIAGMAQVVAATANNSTTTLLGTPVDLPRVGATSVDTELDLRPYASTAVAVGLRQQIFDFGRVEAEAAAQRMLSAVERADAADLLVQIETGVTGAYHAVVAARAVLQASHAAESRANRHTEMARTAAKAGLRPAIELARAEADLARYELGALRAESGLHVARTLFAAACGVTDQELEAAGSEPSLPELKPLSSVLELQRAHDPLVLKSKALAAAQKAQAAAVDAQDNPRLYASASVSGRAGGAPASNGVVPTGNGLLPSVANWHVGVVLAWPMYDPVQRERYKVAELLGRAREAELQAVERAQRAQVTALYEQARVAAAALSALERAARAARANHALAEQRFSVGLGSSIELSDAEMLLVEAEVQLALGQSEALQRRALLARTIGGEP